MTQMVWDLIKKHKVLIVLASILSAASALAGLALISMVSNNAADVSGDNIGQGLAYFAAGIVGLMVLGFLAEHLLALLSTSVVRELRTTMVRRILNTAYEKIESLGGHRIYATITADINAISNALAIVPVYTFNLTTALLCLGYLAYLSWSHFLVVSGVLCLAVVVAKFFMDVAMKQLKILRERLDSLFENFKGLVDGGKELNLNTNRKVYFYENDIEPVTDDIRKTEMKALVFWNLAGNWSKALIFVALGALVFYAKMFSPLPNAVMISYVLVITYLIGPIGYLMNALDPIAKGYVAANKVGRLDLSEGDRRGVRSLPANSGALPSKGVESIEFNQVCYAYDCPEGEQPFVFGPATMTVGGGELVFVTGGNGSGKSTFAKLLTGLYVPSDGVISINGEEIDDKKRVWYRNQFSSVFSDFYLFSQVLDKAGDVANDARVNEEIERLGLAGKVSVSNGRLSTTDLSQGQRKRLALLVAWLEDSAIYLFDEWAADQDPEFREYFYKEILPRLKRAGKTVIAITHDDRYFHLADRLLRFEEGHVREIVTASDDSAANPDRLIQPA